MALWAGGQATFRVGTNHPVLEWDRERHAASLGQDTQGIGRPQETQTAMVGCAGSEALEDAGGSQGQLVKGLDALV